MPKPIDFTNPNDVDCVVQAGLGLYSRAIGSQFGYSPGQAQLRIARGGGSEARKEWRNGKSPLYKRLSRQVVKETRADEQERLMEEYAKHREKQIKERAKIVRRLQKEKAAKERKRRAAKRG